MRKEINQSLGPWSRDKGKSRVGQKSYSERNSVAEHKGKKGPWLKKELPFVSSNNAENRSDRFISSKAACANNVAATNANRSNKRHKESNDFPAASSKRKKHGVWFAVNLFSVSFPSFFALEQLKSLYKVIPIDKSRTIPYLCIWWSR